jgi:hypothetical protein
MKYLSFDYLIVALCGALFAAIALTPGCSASFNGAATAAAPGDCGGHMTCGSFCCTEAEDGATDWECGGTWPECKAGTCCYTGEGAVGPGDHSATFGGARAPVSRVVPLTARR